MVPSAVPSARFTQINATATLCHPIDHVRPAVLLMVRYDLEEPEYVVVLSRSTAIIKVVFSRAPYDTSFTGKTLIEYGIYD